MLDHYINMYTDLKKILIVLTLLISNLSVAQGPTENFVLESCNHLLKSFIADRAQTTSIVDQMKRDLAPGGPGYTIVNLSEVFLPHLYEKLDLPKGYWFRRGFEGPAHVVDSFSRLNPQESTDPSVQFPTKVFDSLEAFFLYLETLLNRALGPTEDLKFVEFDLRNFKKGDMDPTTHFVKRINENPWHEDGMAIRVLFCIRGDGTFYARIAGRPNVNNRSEFGQTKAGDVLFISGNHRMKKVKIPANSHAPSETDEDRLIAVASFVYVDEEVHVASREGVFKEYNRANQSRDAAGK